MKKFSFIVAVFALFLVGTTSVTVHASMTSTEMTSPTGKGGISHPDFTGAELKAVFLDIASQIGLTYEDVVSLYERDDIVLVRTGRTTYKAIVTLPEDGGFSQVLLGEIF